MRKNVSGQFVGVQMVSATDGSAFTGTVTVYVTGDAGTQAIGSVGSGICTHEGNGFHTYAPATAETNYNHVAFTFIGTGAVPATVQIYTESINRHDTVRLGMTALPNAAADAAGGLPISDAGGLDLDARLDAAITSRMASYTQPTGFLAATFPVTVASTTNITAGTITTTTNLTNAPTAGSLTAAMKAEVNAEVDTALADVGLTVTITGRIDAAITTRASQTSVDDVPTNAELAAAFTEIKGATWSAVTDTLEAIRDRGDAAWVTATGFSTHTAADVWTAGTRTLTASLDPTAATIADAVWDEVLAGHLGAGSTGAALNAAGGAGDPWSTALPGAYGAGTAGKIIGDNINATIGSRSTQSSVDTIGGIVAAILVNTDEIGVAGAGLTAIPWNASWDAEVQGEAADALAAYGGPTLAQVVAEFTTIKGAGFSATDTLEAIRDRGDTAWLTATGFSTLTQADIRTATGLASANLDTQIGALASQTSITDVQARIPAALVGGRMDANFGAVNGSTSGVAGFDSAIRSIVRFTVAAGGTLTSIPTTGMTPAAVAVNQFKGLIVKFDKDTATTALRGQGTDITASAADGTLTVSTLTTAPAAGDTGTIE